MSLLFKLTDEDFKLTPQEMNNFRIRLASRGIVLREDGKIALQNKSNKNEYKLVGGGMEENEIPQKAFQREVLEEAGCEIEIIQLLGTTEEYKAQSNFKQISYIFVGKVIEDTLQVNFTKKEKDEGAKLIWETPEKALELITDCYDKLVDSDYENVYATKFVVLRDRKLLEFYMNNI